MKVVLALVVAVLLGVSQKDLQSAVAGPFLLEQGRAGPFEVGMTVGEVYQLAGRDHVRLVATFPEGMFSPVLEIQLAGFTGPAVTAWITFAPIRR